MSTLTYKYSSPVKTLSEQDIRSDPYNVTSISPYAFDKLNLIKEMYIPKSIVKIGDHSFDNMNSKLNVTYHGTQTITCSDTPLVGLNTLYIRVDNNQIQYVVKYQQN